MKIINCIQGSQERKTKCVACEEYKDGEFHTMQNGDKICMECWNDQGRQE